MRRFALWFLGAGLLVLHLTLSWQTWKTLTALEDAARTVERTATNAYKRFVAED